MTKFLTDDIIPNLKEKLDAKQDKLVVGKNISLTNTYLQAFVNDNVTLGGENFTPFNYHVALKNASNTLLGAAPLVQISAQATIPANTYARVSYGYYTEGGTGYATIGASSYYNNKSTSVYVTLSDLFINDFPSDGDDFIVWGTSNVILKSVTMRLVRLSVK